MIVCRERNDRLSPTIPIVGIDVDDRVAAYFYQTCCIGGNDGTPERHCLKRWDAEALGRRWKNQAQRTLIQGGQVVVADVPDTMDVWSTDRRRIGGENIQGTSGDDNFDAGFIKRLRLSENNLDILVLGKTPKQKNVGAFQIRKNGNVRTASVPA